MRNARKYDDRITIGLIPSSEDLEQLKELGYKTIIDLRDEKEKFGGLVERRAKSLGFNYINIPVARDAISLENVKHFYQEVYRKGSAPLYVFSRFGKKPLVFLLLFETVAKQKAIVYIYRKAEKMGFRLQGDVPFQSFVLSLVNSGEFKQIVDEIRESRPDILGEDFLVNNEIESEWKSEEHAFETVADELLQAINNWVSTRDETVLRADLEGILKGLRERRPSGP